MPDAVNLIGSIDDGHAENWWLDLLSPTTLKALGERDRKTARAIEIAKYARTRCTINEKPTEGEVKNNPPINKALVEPTVIAPKQAITATRREAAIQEKPTSPPVSAPRQLGTKPITDIGWLPERVSIGVVHIKVAPKKPDYKAWLRSMGE